MLGDDDAAVSLRHFMMVFGMNFNSKSLFYCQMFVSWVLWENREDWELREIRGQVAEYSLFKAHPINLGGDSLIRFKSYTFAP